MKAGELMGHRGKKTRKEHISRLQGIAHEHGLAKDEIAKIAARTIGFGKIVKEAAEAVPISFGPKVEASWMVCSGIAHGRMWAQLKLDLTETRAPVNAVHSLRMTAPDSGLLVITQTTTSMIAYGWYVFDKKRKKPSPTA